MGICMSSESRYHREVSHRIDKTLEQDSRRSKQECKILLLGSGESGKSTIVKQMKIIHQNGFTTEELMAWRPAVFKNVIESIHAVVNSMAKYGYTYQDPDNEYYAQRAIEYPLTDYHQAMEGELATSINRLWADPSVHKMLDEKGNRFYLMDAAPYFFDEIDRIGGPDYIPNTQDVLYTRIKTTGITETRFTMGKVSIHMFDVGGQRSERKKWIHCFEGVTLIIFCVALSEYDQVLLEEASQNRMVESLVLFDSVVNSRWFLRTSIVLFLNKIDVFEAKLPKSPLENYFPDYEGGPDPKKAAKFILWKFDQLNRANLNVYPHLTQATDTSNIRLVFAAIKETILQNALKDSGIL
ncbi:G protein alpha subunit [Phycomyces blakesleeanus]|uniref:G protein alpha subunit n=2 Tax=Phycomyces blakesleeanus TaxID=4837 RepID=A0A162XYP3_PHYB8|nr:G protein alpha subunit [Phycomyces blakesleeanus NRRL 1555(-)]OAD77345.1 G protein alpha subunit [Phycomyces blakesleeanus NRRL 1555(-)]|eukprot:XP_018295385.1 G protein alpha subunit [Phycomyces blakesleeanus NRRL 1555(-)]